MKKVGLSILIVLFVCVSNAQNVLTIADDNITLDEFKSVFYKNNHNTDMSNEYLNEYMQLFINFKLKVKEAEELGLDTITSFITELDGYKKQLAKPYLRNNDFDANMLAEAYDRMQKDIKASHILIAIEDKASEDSEQKVYQKALAIREAILNGDLSFEAAAKKYSDDKSAALNGGDLGYFTVFMMVYDFETAAFETNIGEISMPVRTKYGYHLVKVNSVRDAVGKVKVAHIMFKAGKGADKKTLKDAKDKINKALQLLENGEEFADVAERFSEDRSTAVKGGSLPSFGVGKMVPEFENIAFSLQKVGDISIPFRTEYGWHIITLLEKEEILEFSEIEAELKRRIERDSRGELSQKALYEKLHESYNIVNKPTVFSAFRKIAVNKVSKGIFVKNEINNSTLLTIDGSKLSVDIFAEYILENQTKGSDIDAMYLDFINQQLLAYEEENLEEKYPEYKALLKEYREGILLFNLTNKKVWNKAVKDTLGLQEFFIRNQNDYMWENRIDASVYSCIDLETAKSVKRDIYKKRRGLMTDSDILAKTNKGAALSLQIESKKFTNGDNKYIDLIDKKIGFAKDIVLEDGSYILVDIHELLDSENKALDETRGKVISDYQNTLDAEWIASLRMKYSVVIDVDLLNSLIK